MDDSQRHVIDLSTLPPRYPTHRHSAAFWEALGRAVATFGFLEGVLGRAIFALTATRPYSDEAALNADFGKWLVTLQGALKDPLGALIDTYGKALRNHPDATLDGLPELLSDLKAAASVRNAICHGSWGVPDAQGFSQLQYFDRSLRSFDTPINDVFLSQLQEHVSVLSCVVRNTITHMGWRFPGTNETGIPIL